MKSLGLLLVALVVAGSVGAAEPDVKKDGSENTVDIVAIPLDNNIYMLMGQGGNIGLSVGKDGTFLIDDQYAPLSEKILAAIREVSGDIPKFLLNTHWHGDHTGGNENLGKAGSLIVAQENVRKRMSAWQFIKALNIRTQPAPDAALPVITFDSAMTFYWNGDEIHLQHMAHAHTDGDTAVYFKRANVIHAGDTFFNGFYPFIDVDTGGSLQGMIAATDRILAMADDDTKIIPGHGPAATKRDLQVYHDMLVKVGERIAALLAEGSTKAEVIAAKPTADFDGDWGDGFLKPDIWVGLVVDALQATPHG